MCDAMDFSLLSYCKLLLLWCAIVRADSV